MSENTWSHRIARPVAYRLAAIDARPNAVTLLRFATGLLAGGAFALGTRDASVAAGIIFVFSCFLDRLDGELARVTNACTPFGEKLDRFCDLIVTVLVFTGIGIGLRDSIVGGWAPVMGLTTGVAVVTIYALLQMIKTHHGNASTNTTSMKGLFDHDDALYLIGPVAWFDVELSFLILATFGAPAYALYMWSSIEAPSALTSRRPRMMQKREERDCMH